MIVAGFLTRVGFSNLKNSGPWFKNFGTAESKSEKVTPATSVTGRLFFWESVFIFILQGGEVRTAAHQRWLESGFLLSDLILFLKYYIRIRYESCFGWNHLILSENYPKVHYDAQHRFLCFVYFASWGKITSDLELFCLQLNMTGWSSHMTSLERMFCLVEHDIYNSSIPCMDDVCHGFRAGKHLAASCLHQVNCRLNPNSKHWTPQLKKLRSWPYTMTISPDYKP